MEAAIVVGAFVIMFGLAIYSAIKHRDDSDDSVL